ncbi:MAG: chemotaxis-specific protein-glutamate methyltransferase CheB [Planctomycetes bacterium]|nr:chemotaxis-specific protein-glutamate methyltransferase CheB [Planctomycetota bacterium]
MRIGLVNDLPIALEALRRTVARIPEATVAWTAMDGAEAVARCAHDRPDIVLMDLIMPVMDGVEATRCIMQQAPCSILVVTATVTGNAARVFEALGAGALDAIDTPNLNDPAGVERLCKRIQTIVRLSRPVVAATASLVVSAPRAGSQPLPTPALLGASTGGPQALRRVLLTWPEPLPFAAVIVQHLDAGFVPGLAEWLGRECHHKVKIAEPGQAARAGTVYLAGGSQHLVLDSDCAFRHQAGSPSDIHQPSVDALLESAARAGLQPGVSAILTGMGTDGARGLLALRRAGWTTLAQDQDTSVVWGMPGAAVQCGAATRVLGVDQIGPAILAHFSESGIHRP